MPAVKKNTVLKGESQTFFGQKLFFSSELHWTHLSVWLQGFSPGGNSDWVQTSALVRADDIIQTKESIRFSLSSRTIAGFVYNSSNICVSSA